MKLGYFDSQMGDQESLKAKFPDWDVQVYEESLDEVVTRDSDFDVISIFVDSKVGADQLKLLAQLKMIAARSAGFDHIDTDVCKQREIRLANVPHYGEHTVAEHTFSLMLALSRKLELSLERTERMNFSRAGLTGFDLAGKVLGIIGYGNIGQVVGEIGLGFGMELLVSDPNYEKTISLEDVLRKSDVVTLHVPFSEKTRHLISRDKLELMKDSAILINTARGGLVDTEALLTALQAGKLAGVGLDVLEEEQDTFERMEFLSRRDKTPAQMAALLNNHELALRDDVVITPHNAFNSVEAINRIFNTTIENIQAWKSGESLNVVV
jgi:D-lactate dehydrogenase